MTTINKTGYLIAQNNTRTTFFTSSSAYDKPKFVPVTEATNYPTAEIAHIALTKLYKNGIYSAKLVEAVSMQFDFPDEGPNKNQPSITQTSGEEDMTAGQLSGDPEEDLNDDGDDEIEMGDDFDREFDEDDDQNQEEQSITSDERNPHDIGQWDQDYNIGQFGDDHNIGQWDQDYNYGQVDNVDKEENEQSFTTPIETQMMQGRRSKYPNGQGPMRESVNMPKRPSLDAKPSENKNTALDTKKAKLIKFKQTAGTPNDVNYSQDIEPSYTKINVPKNVMRAIAASIKTFDEASEFNNGRDDAMASMALTISSALRELKACLDLGTQEGLTQAQIKITTYMNPITTNLPPEIFDYLSKAGRQPTSLKNMFYSEWDKKKGF